MSTETKTTIPNYQDAYEKAQRCIKLAMDAVKHLSGFENYFTNGGIHSKDKADLQGESIIPKKR